MKQISLDTNLDKQPLKINIMEAKTKYDVGDTVMVLKNGVIHRIVIDTVSVMKFLTHDNNIAIDEEYIGKTSSGERIVATINECQTL